MKKPGKRSKNAVFPGFSDALLDGVEWALPSMPNFIDIQPTLENYWRSVILFGRNVASYKFALGKSLLELAQQQKEVISLQDLSIPFSRHLCDPRANRAVHFKRPSAPVDRLRLTARVSGRLSTHAPTIEFSHPQNVAPRTSAQTVNSSKIP
jgi:hypothetical protein